MGSRQPWTYWLRLLTALGAVSVLAILAATGQSRLGRTDGFVLFAGSTTVLFFIASLNGLRSTCDCIGTERRQGTLVLLFLASLKLNTILVSKLVTHSLRNTWAFLGTLPVLGLCLLLGGVSGLMFMHLVFYLLLLPASLYLFWPTRPGLVTLSLVVAYCAIAVLMRRKLTRMLERADGLHLPR